MLDSLIAGVNIVELDPDETYVGYGGLPNADGVVQLDSCCMHGPLRRAGGVAALEGVRTPSRVARAVLDNTDHHLLVGAGAQAFARQMGFAIEADLNTAKSRARWLEWKRRVDPGHWLDPAKRSEAAEAARRCDGGGRAPRRKPPLRHDQLRRRGAEGGGLRRHHHQRARLQDPRARGRLADPGRRALGGRRGGGRRLDRARRGQPLQPLVLPHRRGDAAGPRGPRTPAMEALRRVKAGTVEKRLLDPKGNPELPAHLLRRRQEGRVRRRLDVRARGAAARSASRSAPRTGRSSWPASRSWGRRPPSERGRRPRSRRPGRRSSPRASS